MNYPQKITFIYKNDAFEKTGHLTIFKDRTVINNYDLQSWLADKKTFIMSKLLEKILKKCNLYDKWCY